MSLLPNVSLPPLLSAMRWKDGLIAIHCNFRKPNISWRASWGACSQILLGVTDYSCSPPPKSVLSCYIKLSCTSLQLAPPHHLATTWLYCEHTLILFVTMCLPPSTACWLWEFYSLWLPENPGPDRGTQESWIITGGGFQLKNNVHNIICCGIPSWVSWEGAMIPSHRNSKSSTIILLVCCGLKAI